MFKELCGYVNDPAFWDEFNHPVVSRGNLKYYLPKFCERVKYLADEKELPESYLEGFARTMAIRKFRVSCKRYYNTNAYTEEDKKNGGKHLRSIVDCYEWIALKMGASEKVLEEIRLGTDARFSSILLTEADVS